MKNGRKHIQIIKRTEEELQAYREGFNAGVRMCQNAITNNYARLKEMMQGIAITMMMESERRQCSECIYFEVDSNFATDFCKKYKESANSYDDACVEFEERVENDNND